MSTVSVNWSGAKSRIGRKLALALMGVSLVVITLGAAGQVYFEYLHGREEVERLVGNIHSSMEPMIKNSLWITNDELLITAMRGIVNIPSIEQVIIRKADGTVLREGRTEAWKPLVHTHGIVKTYRGRDVHLGEITLVANLESVFHQLLDLALVRVLILSLLALLPALAAMWLFHLFAGRHLKHMAAYSQALTIDTLALPLELEKPASGAGDELDQLAAAVNDMRGKLQSSLAAERDREAQYRLLYENMVQGVLFLRADGIWLDCNQAFLDMFGMTREQIAGKNFADLSWRAVQEDGSAVPPEAFPAMAALQTGQPVRDVVAGISTPVRQDYVWMNINAIPQFRKGKALPYQVFVTFKDITERKQMEDYLRQTQQLESVGRLAGGIAHDFNNLLYPIVGMAEMLMEDHAPDSESYECAEEIFKAARRGSELVNQILALSRQTRQERLPIRIQPILKEALQLARATIPANISIRSEIQGDCGKILADPIQMHQVILNLITNAYHAVELSGGSIAVHLQTSVLTAGGPADSVLDPGNYVHLSVADTGCGIDPAVMERIFEPYFTTKALGRGSGLGLAVVYGIVRGHGGDIRIGSRLNEGTTVDVYLPQASGESVSEPLAGAADKITCRTGRILLVDDEAPIVRLETKILERLGHRITACASSTAALKAFTDDPDGFDLVITDMSMPQMTGERLAGEMLAIRPELPVILCTGYRDWIDEAAARAIGIKGFLMKPIDKADLVRLVCQVMDRPPGR